MTYDEIAFILEIIGTIAFASSGAILGIRKQMDIFGVMVLGVITALGGGLIRDLVLGIIPPSMFKSSNMTALAVVTSLIIFGVFYFKIFSFDHRAYHLYQKLILIMDAVGLGAFTSIGISKAVELGYERKFLLIFVGMVTGIGGGIIRDVLSNETPLIFKEEIYAVASLLGTVFFLVFYHHFNIDHLMIGTSVIVIIIRILCENLGLDLPRVK